MDDQTPHASLATFLALAIAMDQGGRTMAAIQRHIWDPIVRVAAEHSDPLPPYENEGRGSLVPEETTYMSNDVFSNLRRAASVGGGRYVWVADEPRVPYFPHQFSPGEGTATIIGMRGFRFLPREEAHVRSVRITVYILRVMDGTPRIADWVLRLQKAQQYVGDIRSLSVWTNPDIPSDLAAHVLQEVSPRSSGVLAFPPRARTW